MRINHWQGQNEVKSNFTPYYIAAILIALIAFYFFTFTLQIIIMVTLIIIEYWIYAIIGLFVLIFIKKKVFGKKKQEQSPQGEYYGT